MGELKQLFHEDLNALKLVMRLLPGQVALKSHMFVNLKYKANGDYNKMKARLVADGRGQDTKLYLETFQCSRCTVCILYYHCTQDRAAI